MLTKNTYEDDGGFVDELVVKICDRKNRFAMESPGEKNPLKFV